MHDWSRVDAGIYHAFLTVWSAEIQKALNGGLLPDGFYALIEQHAGQALADVLTLHASAPSQGMPPLPSTGGGTALAEAPPKVRRKQLIEPVAHNVLVVDPILPGPHDPRGIHDVIQQCLEMTPEPYVLPADEPLTLASYAAGQRVQAYLEHAAIGAPVPDMPLFLTADRYIDVPLEATYQIAYAAMPAYWRSVLESTRAGVSPETHPN